MRSYERPIGALIRDTTNIPTHVVAGNLFINNRKIFISDQSSEEVSQVFEKSNYSWDGHVWVSFAGIIGDISIFRTAYSQPKDHWLHQLIINEFGMERGLILGPKSNMTYEAKYVLTDKHINSLIKGMQKFI